MTTNSSAQGGYMHDGKYRGDNSLLQTLYPQLQELTEAALALKAFNDALGNVKGALNSDSELLQRLERNPSEAAAVIAEQTSRRAEWFRIRQMLEHVILPPVQDLAQKVSGLACQLNLANWYDPTPALREEAAAFLRVRQVFDAVVDEPLETASYWLNSMGAINRHDSAVAFQKVVDLCCAPSALVRESSTPYEPIWTLLPFEYQILTQAKQLRPLSDELSQLHQLIASLEDDIEGMTAIHLPWRRKGNSKFIRKTVRTSVLTADKADYADYHLRVESHRRGDLPRCAAIRFKMHWQAGPAKGYSFASRVSISSSIDTDLLVQAHNAIGAQALYNYYCELLTTAYDMTYAFDGTRSFAKQAFQSRNSWRWNKLSDRPRG